jgi:hypothetical protein
MGIFVVENGRNNNSRWLFEPAKSVLPTCGGQLVKYQVLAFPGLGYR